MQSDYIIIGKTNKTRSAIFPPSLPSLSFFLPNLTVVYVPDD